MSEAEIRAAIERAKSKLDEKPEKPLSTGWSRMRKVAAGVAVGLGLSMIAACYGAPHPRPMPQDDAAHRLTPGQLESQLGETDPKTPPAKP